MSIATEITRLQTAKSDIKTAIEGKGVSVPSSALLDSYPDYIDAIQQGGADNPVADDNDVIFIDFDGTIRYSYSAADFANLTELPANPFHAGLTAQGWNWTLADAQEYVAKYRSLIIGALYITDDGKTRLYIDIANPGRMNVPLHFNQTISDGVTINWGDGSAEETVSGTGNKEVFHTFSSVGSYVITLDVTSGTAGLGGSSTCIGRMANDFYVYTNMLIAAELGANMNLSNNAFNGCRNIKRVTIPNGITIWDSAFSNATIRAATLPPSVTNVRNNTFYSALALQWVSFPKGATTFGNNMFSYVYSLRKVCLPEGATSYGSSFTYSCYAMTYIAIPPSVTSLGANMFYNCYGLKELWMFPTTPPSFGTTPFTGTPADMVIYVPQGSLAAYQGATGWSAYASQMVEMS